MTTIRINGRQVDVAAEPDTPLLWVLRGELKLTGTKFGCGMAVCGACTVHLDGKAIRSCVTPLSAIGTRAVTTIEGLSGAETEALNRAWIDSDVVQCGYCQPGQIMSACALLRASKSPDDTAIDTAMSGNLCRCGTYPRIRAAIHAASKSLSGDAQTQDLHNP